ncbi:MAG: hypothetical protein Q8Q09_25655 [Deltaproteobacteria bacterium]|nr:hypothetical protein [Deltaproteobacteria bacterium]
MTKPSLYMVQRDLSSHGLGGKGAPEVVPTFDGEPGSFGGSVKTLRCAVRKHSRSSRCDPSPRERKSLRVAGNPTLAVTFATPGLIVCTLFGVDPHPLVRNVVHAQAGELFAPESGCGSDSDGEGKPLMLAV